MEELKRLSLEYYKNTVNLKYFGFVGGFCIFSSIPFIFAALFINITQNGNVLAILPMIVAGTLWNVQKRNMKLI